METKTTPKMNRTSSSSIENALFSIPCVSLSVFFPYELLNEHARDYLSETRYQIRYGYGLLLLHGDDILTASMAVSTERNHQFRTIEWSSRIRFGFSGTCAYFRCNDSSLFPVCLRATPRELFSMHSCRVPTVSAAAARTHY